MNRHMSRLVTVVAAIAALFLGAGAHPGWAEAPLSQGLSVGDVLDHGTWAEVSAWVKSNKAVIELGDASIIVEVNATDGDAGFQIFVDGDGWKNVRVFDSNGNRILKAMASGGVREIGGGTELFMESAEPEYEDLDGMQELLDLLPVGEYFFIARTTNLNWATGTAELTHVIPAEPEVITPLAPEDECAADVPYDAAVIEWHPVEETITGSGDIEIVLYQVIVETEDDADPHREFSAFVTAETTMVAVPPEFLEPGTEYKFEILAIEESGNQTITESCFETAE